MPKLVIHPGTPQAEEFNLKPGTNYVGRGFANDINIEDSSVSSSHAQIILNAGAVMVRDLGSTNGTFIDRSQVTEAALAPGHVLRLGGVEMVLEADSPATPAAAPAVRVAIPAGADVVSIPARAPGLRIPPPPVPSAGGGLRVSGSSVATAPPPPPPPPAPAPPMEDPPLAPPIPNLPMSAPVAGKTNCKFHPKSPGRWLCPKCGNLYCDLCVSTRAGHAEGAYFCRPCGAPCSQVAYQPTINPLEEGSFFTQLPGAFTYPFKKGGGILLVCATIFFVVVDLVRRLPTSGFFFIWIAKWFLTIMYFGYLYSYLQNVIHTAAQGDEHDPELPDITDIAQDLVAPFLQLVCTIILCFGPAIALAIWGFFGESPMITLGVIPAIVLGSLYFPMAFLSVAMFDTVGGINPLVVIPAMFKVPFQYLVACLLFGVVVTVYWLGSSGLLMILPIPVLPTIISSFVWLYLLTVMARILGILYFVNRDRFGWYNT